jgi:surface polysaccharide O-acyltransferase-like enzyme
VFPSRRAAFPAAFLTGVAAFCLRLIWPTGTNFLQMQLGYFASYMVLFAFGILGYRRGWLEAIPSGTVRFWSWTAVTAILLLPVFVVFGGAISGNIEPFQGGFYWQAAVYSLWEPFVAFGIILFLFSWFRRHLDRAGTLLRALSESSYTAYIIHPPVIVGISLLAQGAMVPPLFKFVIVGAAGIAVCFMVSYLITRIPGVKRVL